MSGKSKTTTSSNQNSTSELNAYAPVKPVIDQGAGILKSYLDNPESNAVYDGQRVADLSGATRTGVDMLQQSGGANDAANFYRGIIGGGAGGMNPQVQQMQDAIKRQVLANQNSQFSRAGMTGGTAHQESLAKGLSDGLAQPLFAAYENDMSRQMAAAGALPGVDQMRIQNQLGAGQILDSHAQAGINADMQRFEENRTSPIRAWSEVAPTAMQLGSMFGRQTGNQTGTSTQTNQQSSASLIGGAAMAGLGLMGGNPMGALRGLSGAMGGGGGYAQTDEVLPWLNGGRGGYAQTDEFFPWLNGGRAQNSTFNFKSLFGGR